jgi:hypothetical protein
VRGVVVLIAGLAAAGVAVLVGGVLGYELAGHIRRLRRAVTTANSDLQPKIRAIIPPASEGRHRAPAPPG